MFCVVTPQAATNLSARITSDDDRRKEWVESASKEASESIALQQQLDAATREIEVIKRRISEIEHTSATHTQTIATIELKLPALEAEKKHAATTRDFKTAGRVAGQIKDFQSSKQKAADTLAELKTQTSGLQTSLTEKTALKAQIAVCLMYCSV